MEPYLSKSSEKYQIMIRILNQKIDQPIFEYRPIVSSGSFVLKYLILSQAFQIINRIYRNRCARIIQRVWDRYWYSPNNLGESRVAKSSYDRYLNRKTVLL